MSIQRFAVWCERQLAQVVMAEGLHVAMRGAVQGPMTLTYRLQLQPTRAAVQKMLALETALGLAVGSEVRVAVQGPSVALEVALPAPAQRTPRGEELAQHGRGLTVCVGLDSLRKPALLDLRQHGAVLWVGPSRRGKTQSLRCTVAQLIDYANLVIVSFKTDWDDFALTPGCLGVVRRADEALAALVWAAQNMRAAQNNSSIVVVVDDLLNLLEAAPGVAGPLGEIASMGAGAGTHLLVGTQEAGSRRGTGGGGVEANATARILYKAPSAAAAARSAGMAGSGLDGLSTARGDALLLVDGEARRIATGQLPDGGMGEWGSGGARLSPPWQVVADNRAQPGSTGRNQGQPAVAPPTSDADAGHVTGGGRGDGCGCGLLPLTEAASHRSGGRRSVAAASTWVQPEPLDGAGVRAQRRQGVRMDQTGSRGSCHGCVTAVTGNTGRRLQ